MAGLVASPLCAKYSDSIGAKKLYAIGVTVLGISCICYGLLVYVEDKVLFLGVSYFLRWVLT